MNGYQLYQHYTKAGQVARRDSDVWYYGQLLQRAFYLVGITRLFDLLEQAEASNKQVGLVYTSGSTGGLPMAGDIELIDQAPPTIYTGYESASQLTAIAPTYSWLFS